MRSHAQPPLQTWAEGGGARGLGRADRKCICSAPAADRSGAGSSGPTGEAKCAVPGARTVFAEPAWARLGEAGVRGVWWAT